MEDVRDYTMSEVALTQRQQAPLKHSVHALEQRGPEALDAQQIGRLSELRQLVREDSGRAHLRLELTARMYLVCELGFAHLRDKSDAGDDIWSGGLIRRLSSYVAETRRLLESLPSETSEPASITDVLMGSDDNERA